MSVHIVVAYDVASDRRRARLAKKLLDFLPRVQKSVFEGPIPQRRLPALRKLLEETIDHDTDSVRIYHLCAGCVRRTEHIGTGPAPGSGPEEDLVT